MSEALKYPKPMRIMHWLMAVLVIGLLAVGLLMGDMADSPAKWQVYGLHKSFGIIVLALLIIRIGIRLKSTVPPLNPTFSTLIKRLANLNHLALYVLMLIMPASGYLMSMLGGHGVSVFGLPLPNLVGEDKKLGHLAYETHEIAANLLIAVLVLHILAVIKHAVDKQDVFRRMW